MSLLAGISDPLTITPPLGAPLLGPTLPSTGVHDDLQLRALVLAGGNTSVAIICADLVGTTLEVADCIRERVRRETGMGTGLLNCSHTHSAPFTIPWSITGPAWLEADGRSWQDGVVDTAVEAVRQAAGRMQPATIAGGRAQVQIGMNRRLTTETGTVMAPNAEGLVVPWVDVLRVDDARGRTKAILFEHACHPVAVHAASRLVSADYVGYARDAIREDLGDEVAPLFAQGFGANINAEPLRGGFEVAARLGRTLAEATVAAVADAELIHRTSLTAASRSLALPLRDWPEPAERDAALAETEERLRQAKAEGATDEEMWYLTNRVLCLRDLCGKARSATAESVRFEVQTLSIGDAWSLVAMPHEVVCEYQLWATGVSPFPHTMCMAYTNGCETYVPTDADLGRGGYEATDALSGGAALFYPYRRVLRAGHEARIRDAIQDCLKAPGAS